MRGGPLFPKELPETSRMNRTNTSEPSRGRAATIFTDIHFWVPAVVLVGGLLLLAMIH
jgi:hypothetical protein